MERLAPLLEARRAASDLRLDVWRVGRDESDAPLPAAAPDHRLVRRSYVGHPQRAGEDGGRHDTRHRHGGAAGGLLAPARPAGVTPGLRPAHPDPVTDPWNWPRR